MKRKIGKKIFLLVAIGVVLVGAGLVSYYFCQPPLSVSPVWESALRVRVYFFKGERLYPVTRPLRADEVPLKRAIIELIAGPREEEVAKGVISYLPPAVRLLNFSIQGKTAILNFNREFENYGGGSARLRGMIAQVVYTATEIPGIERAWIWLEGEKNVVLGGEGLVLDHPLSRQEVSY